MVNEKRIMWGLGLMGVGFFPTPDDVTIISPLLQIGVGSILIISGLIDKK